MRILSLLIATTLSLAALIAATTGWAQTPPAPVTGPATPAPAPSTPLTLNDGYVLGIGDVIEVAILGREDYRARTQIQANGTVQLPLINDVPAANRTILQLRDDIRGALVNGGFFVNPAVAVGVASYASRYVTVLGEVATPGLLPIDRAYRVSEILARVGGPRPTAGTMLVLTRENGERIELDITQAAMGREGSDPVVNPNDRIFIDVAPQFYVLGQVNAPGSYRIDRNMTFRMALARSGGLTAMGSERRIEVIRNGETLSNIDLNSLVQPGDTINVRPRLF
jgi:polysaccharide export outer membrane protein